MRTRAAVAALLIAAAGCAARAPFSQLRINGNRVASAEVGYPVAVVYFYPGAAPVDPTIVRYEFHVNGQLVATREVPEFYRWIQFIYTPSEADYYEAIGNRLGNPYSAEFIEEDFDPSSVLRSGNVEVNVQIRVFVDNKQFDATHGAHLLLGCMLCQ